MKKLYAVIASTLLLSLPLLFSAGADVLLWDGGAGDSLLSSANNWDPNQTPVAGDTLNIGNGDTVQHENNLPLNTVITLSGNSSLSTQTSVIRLNDSDIYVSSGSGLTGGFWDLRAGSITFEDGTTATMSNWEQKDFNTFTYKLGTSGFTTLTPGTFRLGTGTIAANITNATYAVDFADFTGGPGDYNITLMDFTTDAAGLTDAAFQGATFNFLNAGGDILSPSLSWDDPTDTINLSFTVAVPEPSTMFLFSAALGLATLRRRRFSK